ncbi:MAG: hypothetical protein OJF49_000740 [Ktedonobacterales bacterium]|jgi:peroxiredoxin|nr:MAG: hypothetical protein OJF49_000740 [Ktedonobacterales bacterium]
MTTSDAPRSRMPRAGQPLPHFALPSTADKTVRLWDYKQRQPVLLAFIHTSTCPACRAWLARLARERARLDEARAAVLVIAPDALDELRALQVALDLPFTLLADSDGMAARAYVRGAEDSGAVALYAGDRYGLCVAGWHAPDADGLPPLDAPLADFALAEQDDCACTIPAWDEEE